MAAVADPGQYGGIETDLYELPVGTRFHVCNGAWNGAIIRVNGAKCVHVFGTEKYYEITPGETLWITITKDRG